MSEPHEQVLARRRPTKGKDSCLKTKKKKLQHKNRSTRDTYCTLGHGKQLSQHGFGHLRVLTHHHFFFLFLSGGRLRPSFSNLPCASASILEHSLEERAHLGATSERDPTRRVGDKWQKDDRHPKLRLDFLWTSG